MTDRRKGARTALGSRRGRTPTRDALAVAATVLLANTPTQFAFYVVLDTSDSASAGLLRHAATTMSGALVFAVLWTGIVFFAFGPALAGARRNRQPVRREQ
ncbi:hypothetical protein [Haladaptatus salinisoli]|uniref:hypothetical protein n=1 Tax=Haladaptatus salinisoli TaxID=2884876 RepID=UPI001D0A6F66|nr:hypothetical protein [Haladaptatus salinisoli]